jgi:hypothetical protein
LEGGGKPERDTFAARRWQAERDAFGARWQAWGGRSATPLWISEVNVRFGYLAARNSLAVFHLVA